MNRRALPALIALSAAGTLGLHPYRPDRTDFGAIERVPVKLKTQPPRPYRRPLKERKERNRRKKQRRLR